MHETLGNAVKVLVTLPSPYLCKPLGMKFVISED